MANRDQFNIRVYSQSRASDLEREMARLGCESIGIERMLPKAQHYVIKIHGVCTPGALILKESMLSKGGDAAIHRDCITSRIDRSDVLLMGTAKVLKELICDLREQPFSLSVLADEIERVIDAYTRPIPALPSESDLPEKLSAFYRRMRERTLVMGILNVTPDSFSDGGLYFRVEDAIDRGLSMVEEGADVIDVGGESSRPGADPISVEEELRRVIPVVEHLANKIPVPLSIDTYKPDVARAALNAGASIINDITGLRDPEMRALVAERKCPACIMHMKGTPKTMQENPVYEDVVSEIMAFLRQRIEQAVEAGVPEELLIIDPGIGFGKTLEHNIEILRNLRDLRSVGRPILIGASRKRFIGVLSGDLPPEERLEGTAAAVALSIANGANIVRVHDVREMVRVARVADAVARSQVAIN